MYNINLTLENLKTIYVLVEEEWNKNCLKDDDEYLDSLSNLADYLLEKIKVIEEVD